MIPKIDLQALNAKHPTAVDALISGISKHGFLIVHNAGLSVESVAHVIETYRRFFLLDTDEKSRVSMAKTGSNRGWGASGSEQVDPNANPDYKEVFDSGYVPPIDHNYANYPVYAPNQWPKNPPNFEEVIRGYYDAALHVAMEVLHAIASALGLDQDYFSDKFSHPMALLRGNYYPARPDWASDKDFGIAAHTDYGCVTFLATDGVNGLEVQSPNGDWVNVQAEKGEFIINFGEMLQMWTDGVVRATPHRVRGSDQERISVPLFFNPNYDTNVAPLGSTDHIKAGDHLKKRFEETYLHLKK